MNEQYHTTDHDVAIPADFDPTLFQCLRFKHFEAQLDRDFKRLVDQWSCWATPTAARANWQATR